MAIVLLWPIIATIVSFLIKPNSAGSTLLFLGIPSLYLAIRGREYVKKVFIFSIIVAVPTIIVLDYIAQVSGSWAMHITSIIPFKFFGIVTFEVVLWAFFTCFFIIIFYEYFLDKHVTHRLYNPKMKYLLIIILVVFVLFLVFLFASSSLLNIPYFYFIFGIILFFIPFLFQFLEYPKATSKFFLVTAYFFYFNFIYEITAVKLGWWAFPGKYFIGWISMFGIRFPLEELLFWFILMILAILSFFEFFDDDEK